MTKVVGELIAEGSHRLEQVSICSRLKSATQRIKAKLVGTVPFNACASPIVRHAGIHVLGRQMQSFDLPA